MPLRRRPRDENGGQELAELAALADGSLAPERRAALEARVAASPELADRLAEQQRAVTLATSAAAEVEAPAALRTRVDARRRERRRPRPSRLVAIGPQRPRWPPPSASGWAYSVRAPPVRASTPPLQRPTWRRAPTARRRSRRRPRAGGSSSTPPGFLAWRADASTRRGCAIRAGVLVPVGTFNEGRKVTLWAGVSPQNFTTFTVTREQADGDQASSGQKVLVGNVPS